MTLSSSSSTVDGSPASKSLEEETLVSVSRELVGTSATSVTRLHVDVDENEVEDEELD